jgi:hypothetical protein
MHPGRLADLKTYGTDIKLAIFSHRTYSFVKQIANLFCIILPHLACLTKKVAAGLRLFGG